MERVAFLIEDTGERIGCLLNPESFAVRRQAGIQPARSIGGLLSGAGLTDDPLLYTGGGHTELQLDLLFDVALANSSPPTDDVRDFTGPLWRLAENAASSDRFGRPPVVRFVWGKSWNVPGIVTAVAERFERFDASGTPRRSWLRLRLVRVSEPRAAQTDESPGSSGILQMAGGQLSPNDVVTHEVLGDGNGDAEESAGGERLDEIASRYYGNAALWRILAEFNDVADPLHIPPGTLLRIPPLATALGNS